MYIYICIYIYIGGFAASHVWLPQGISSFIGFWNSIFVASVYLMFPSSRRHFKMGGCCENGLASPVTYRPWPPGDRWDDPWWKMPWRFWVLWCPLLPDLWKLHPFAARSDNQTWQLNPIVMIFPLKAHLGFSQPFLTRGYPATRFPTTSLISFNFMLISLLVLFGGMPPTKTLRSFWKLRRPVLPKPFIIIMGLNMGCQTSGKPGLGCMLWSNEVKV